MAAWRRAIELSLGDADSAKLRSIAQSRTEPTSRVERARGIVKLTAHRIGADDADVRGIISPAGRTSAVARPERLSSGRGDNGRR
jgi:hypothetical protein